MTKKDYYNILGVSRDASEDDIKAAYKRLAKKYHPDVSKEPGAEEKFKEILEAYNVLSDRQRRQNYDAFGDAAERFAGFRGFEGFGTGMEFDFEDLFNGFSGFGSFGGLGDLFREFSRRRGPQRGANIRYDLNLSFEEAVFGTKKEIEVERFEKCNVCNGSGTKKGTGRVKCDVCNGRGMETKTRKTIFGIFSTSTTCRKCNGSGEVIKEKCQKCNGAGRMRVRRKIKVKIPAGVNTGNHLRLHGEGGAGEEGAEPGDLFVVIFVEPHEIFKRDGKDIFAEIPLSFSEAALGAEVEVPTLKGSAKLKIPRGTQTNTVFRLKGKGVTELGSSAVGDEYIKVIVKTPDKLSRKQKELFEALAKEEGLKRERKGFFDRIKKHF